MAFRVVVNICATVVIQMDADTFNRLGISSAFRWMTTIASSNESEPSSGGQALYKQALFSSRKATNTLLTLLKEAVLLPLPCSNVIHKVSQLTGSIMLAFLRSPLFPRVLIKGVE